MDGDDCASVRSEGSVARYSDASVSGGEQTTKLVLQIYRALAHDGPISTREHLTAATLLSELQASFRPGVAVEQATQIRLVCVITALLRRIVRLRAQRELAVRGGNETSFDESPDDYVGTMTLTFVAVTIADVTARGGVAVDAEAAAADLERAMQRPLWSELSKVSGKRRAEVGEEVDELERQRLIVEEVIERKFLVAEDSSQWETVLNQPGTAAGAAMRVAGGLLASATESDLPRLQELAFVFARATIAQMQQQMLRSTNDRDFLTLSASRFLVDATVASASTDDDEVLATIVAAGESEAGQACLRDLVASFLLPRSVVGVRRTLLLSRETSERVAIDYPWISAAAHETAMLGCESVWRSSTSELKKACALLAGLAMLTTSGSGDDKIRKATAYDGLVQLPFLECPPPETSRSAAPPPKLLALVPSTRSWVVYRVSRSGKPDVELSKRGLDGLCNALLVRKIVH